MTHHTEKQPFIKGRRPQCILHLITAAQAPFNGYIITKCISSTTITADWDFMQISLVFNRRGGVIGELQKVWTHCLRSLMQMTPLGAFGPGIKIKTVLMHFKALVCHFVTGCSNLAQKHTCHLNSTHHCTTATSVDCAFGSEPTGRASFPLR